MNSTRTTGLREDQAIFHGATQNARVMTEEWAGRSLYCPNCSVDSLKRFRSNRPVADLYCDQCGEEFELKSQRTKFGRRVVDGAYATMCQRLEEPNSPSLFLLHYHRDSASVRNVMLIPKFHFSEKAIEKRKPLGPNARRAGWVGCNIMLDRIADSGKIPILIDGLFENQERVRQLWKQTQFLQSTGAAARGWLIETILCAEQTSGDEFSLEDIYAHESRLSSIFPGNNHIRPKLRQQLQVMRDHGLIDFLGGGRYRKRLV